MSIHGSIWCTKKNINRIFCKKQKDVYVLTDFGIDLKFFKFFNFIFSHSFCKYMIKNIVFALPVFCKVQCCLYNVIIINILIVFQYWKNVGQWLRKIWHLWKMIWWLKYDFKIMKCLNHKWVQILWVIFLI